MPQVQLIPIQQPMKPEEIAARLQAGWHVEGQLLVLQSSIATPDNPGGAQAIPVNVWILPEPMIPLGEFLNAIISASDELSDSPALEGVDIISKKLMGKTVQEIKDEITQSQGDLSSQVALPD